MPNNFPSNTANSAAIAIDSFTDQSFVPQALLSQQNLGGSSVFVDTLFQGYQQQQQSLPERQTANLPTFNSQQQAPNPVKRQRMGRKKIQITRIQDERNRQVSFLFRKFKSSCGLLDSVPISWG